MEEVKRGHGVNEYGVSEEYRAFVPGKDHKWTGNIILL
jgi:hypothetical protein